MRWRRPLARAVPVVALVVLAAAAAVADDGGIQFAEDLDAAMQRAAELDRPVVAIFGAAWCPICRELEETTLRAPEIVQLADRFVWARVDIDRQLTLARAYRIEATPTIVLHRADAGPVRRLVGGADAETLAFILASFLEEVEAGEPGDRETRSFPYAAISWTPTGYRGRSICFSHVGYGPLRLRSQSPFQSLRLGISPRTPSTLARGEAQVRVAGTWASIWANDDPNFAPEQGQYGRYLLDYETLGSSLALAYGLADAVELEVEVEHRSRFGGFMDGFVQGFHDLLGIDQSGRDQVPRDQFRFLLDFGGSRPRVDLPRRADGPFAVNTLVTLQHNVTCGTATRPAFSYAVTLRYGLHSPDLEGGNLDVAASVAVARRLGNLYGYLTLGYAWFGSDSFRGIPLDDSQATWLAAVEWRFRPRMSLLLQYLGSEAMVDDMGPFSDLAHEVTLGWKWEASSAGVLEVGFIENVATFDNSPDFGFHMGWTQRF